MPPVRRWTRGNASKIPKTPPTPILIKCNIPSTSAAESNPIIRDDSSGHQEVAIKQVTQLHHHLNNITRQSPAPTWAFEQEDNEVQLNAKGSELQHELLSGRDCRGSWYFIWRRGFQVLLGALCACTYGLIVRSLLVVARLVTFWDGINHL